jgi:subtilisin family serine protease
MLQGQPGSDLGELVRSNGGNITHDLQLIDAVGAKLTRAQLDKVLRSNLVTRHIDDLSDDPEAKPDKDAGKCKVTGHVEAEFDHSGIRWSLYNKRETPASLASLSISWPAGLGEVQSVNVGNAAVDPALFTQSDAQSLRIEFTAPGQPVIAAVAELAVSFKTPKGRAHPGPLRQRDFAIEAGFAEGCSTSLIPGYENNHQDYYYNRVAGVEALHRQGITGRGVNVAIVDSGLWEHAALRRDTSGRPRIIARYDALTDIAGEELVDESGHGTHMASIVAHSGPTLREGSPDRSFKGVAPDAGLVPVKVLDRDGHAHLLDIVRAVQWVVENRERYAIRVLNLSFAQMPRWPYWEDPVNQAVLRAWAAGITVVAAAGNEGPEPMTIGSPGNLPYIITVGAVTDSWTPETRDDDYVPDFSSRGPTPSGHIKPDIVALGGHITGLIQPESALVQEQPEDILATGEYVSTGSSQAAALVSGMVALLLQLEPELSPDDVKCKLISSAEPAINRDGRLAYSPFQQGHGYVTAPRMVTLGQTGCANTDLDLQMDIDNRNHFYGPAIVGEGGIASLPGLEGTVSDTPSEKGMSETRRWGVKAHIERDPPVTHSPGGKGLASDWHQRYQDEKKRIEALSQP